MTRHYNTILPRTIAVLLVGALIFAPLISSQLDVQDPSLNSPLNDFEQQDPVNDESHIPPLPMQIPNEIRIIGKSDKTSSNCDSYDIMNSISASGSNQQPNSKQQFLEKSANEKHFEDTQISEGTVLYNKAKLILDKLPDVPNPNSIGHFYHPRRKLWSVFHDGAFQSICNLVLFPVPDTYRLRICGVPSMKNDKRSQPNINFSSSKYSSTSFPLDRQKNLEILDNNKQELENAFDLLKQASDLGNSDAIYTRAEYYFYGNYTHTQDFFESYELYHKLAETTGNATAQFMLGVMYSTGMFGKTPQDQARANLYYTFSAENGDFRAKMAMGYRHQQGIGTPQNHKLAAEYFRNASLIAYKSFINGPLGGRHLSQYSWLLSDADGGILGEGASSIVPADHYPLVPSAFSQSFDSAARYLDYVSVLNDASALSHFVLAKLYLRGDIVVEPNFPESIKHIKNCIQETLTGDTGNSKSLRGLCSRFIGLRYLRGEGVPQSYADALKWLEIGSKNGDPGSKGALGSMYLAGIGVKRDKQKAKELFKASEHDSTSNFYLGGLYLEEKDISSAYMKYNAAAKTGDLKSVFHLGMLLYRETGDKKAQAAVYLQHFSERVHDFHCPLRWANVQYRQGDYGSALLGFMVAAEEGYREAQLNAAYMLDDRRSVIDINNFFSWVSDKFHSTFFDSNSKESTISPNSQKLVETNNKNTTEETDFGAFVQNISSSYEMWKQQKDFLAFTYWSRLAKTYNIDALVKAGDCLLQGVGVKKNLGEALARYQTAADYNSAIARWNLGWMYENGIGVDKDFHLAKRNYDLAAASLKGASFPVQLSLLKLYARDYWNSLWKMAGNKQDADSSLNNEISIEEGEIFKKSGNQPKSFWEGVWMIFTKLKKERSQTLEREKVNDFIDPEDLDFSIHDLNKIEDTTYSYMIYSLAAIAAILMYQRWRANQQQVQPGEARQNPENEINQQGQ